MVYGDIYGPANALLDAARCAATTCEQVNDQFMAKV
jgi:hypothetical protein